MTEININALENELKNFGKNIFYFLDIDCTLVKSIDPMVRELNKRYNTNVKPIDIKSWNFNEIQHDLTDDDINNLFSLPQFFDELEFYEGAKEFLLNHIDNSIIITKGTPKNIYEKRMWLDLQDLEDVKMIGIPLNVSKSMINMEMKDYVTIFIDDSTHNLNESNANIKIQFREFGETEWNKGWNKEIIRSWN